MNLNLNSCFSLTNKLVPRLAPHLGAVRELTLTGCAQLGDAGMRLLLEATAPRLRVLNAAHITGLRVPFSTLINNHGNRQSQSSSSSSSSNGGGGGNRAFACLEVADFSHCTSLEVAQFIDLVQGSPALTALDLSGVGAPVSSLIFAKLAQCARLHSLCMRRCTVVATRIGRQHGLVVDGNGDNGNVHTNGNVNTDDDDRDESSIHAVQLGEVSCVNHLLRGARALEVLDIAGCRPASAALSELSAGSRTLRSLNANRTSGVLRRIGGRYPALQELHLAWCATLDDESVRAVALSAARLRVLDASGTRITEETRRAIELRFGSDNGSGSSSAHIGGSSIDGGGASGDGRGSGSGSGVQMFLASCRSIPREMRTLAAPGALCDPEPAAPSDEDD